MQPKVLKYILDIESLIEEVEIISTKTQNNFLIFKSDIILQRAAERQLEIIGEALKKAYDLEPSLNISSIKKIIGLRNIISHAYDSVEPEIIWGIIQKDIFALREEIILIKNPK